MSKFSDTAKEVKDNLPGVAEASRTISLRKEMSPPTYFARVASEVRDTLKGEIRTADINSGDSPQRNPEWQRVNSLIADVFKDSGVLYSKIARLQSDFVGPEVEQLENIANNIRSINGELSKFAEDFAQGEAVMAPSQTPFGGGGQPVPSLTQTPAPAEGDDNIDADADIDADIDFDLDAEITDEDEELDKEFEEAK